ncbi:MAG: adenylate/guanylate cyclase domain-containing protein [Candidatus Woesearchaeota archaeon]
MDENIPESVRLKFRIPLNLMMKIAFSNLRISIYLIIIFFLISLPFKIYFYRKKRNKQINEKIVKIVKKALIKTPLIFALIFFLFSFAAIFFGFKKIDYIDFDQIKIEQLKSYIIDTQIISIIASLVSAIFIYSWQTFRVQQYYMAFVFDEQELRFFPVKTHFTSIKYKIILSFIVTTFLPLLFLFFTIYLNVSHLVETDRLNYNHLKIIFGQFSDVILSQPKFNSYYFFEKLNEIYRRDPYLFNYYSSLDTLIMYITFFSSMISSIIYIVTFIRFNTNSIINPIKRLVTNMEKTANHDFSAFTYVESTDEIGQMVVSFNKMLIGLNEKEKIKDLFGQYLTKEISDKILANQINVDGEFFDATILFSDIRDFTKLTQNIPPQEVISFLNEYFNEMIEVAVKYDGIIDKFIGDGMLVVFGVPFQINDHATKALMASIEMNNTLFKLNQKRIEEGKFPIKIGIGLHSGTVLAGNIGNKRKLQYTVIGDTVNVASRIETINKQFSTSILLSEDTYKRLDLNLFDKDKFVLHENVEIRGKSEKFNLYSYQS